MRKRAAAIILQDEELLLIHRQKPGLDYYILPGGGVELDETFRDACIREVKEETGLEVISLQLVHVFKHKDGEEYYFITRVPPGEMVLGGPEAGRQSPTNRYSFEWANARKLETLNLQPAAARRICLEILQRQNGTAERSN